MTHCGLGLTGLQTALFASWFTCKSSHVSIYTVSTNMGARRYEWDLLAFLELGKVRRLVAEDDAHWAESNCCGDWGLPSKSSWERFALFKQLTSSKCGMGLWVSGKS